MGAPFGNKNAIGGKRATAHRPAGGKARAESTQLSALITLLHDRTGLSYDQISGRLLHDFGISISRAACWQRYQRERRT